MINDAFFESYLKISFYFLKLQCVAKYYYYSANRG